MSPFEFLFFIPVTIIFLIVMGVSLVYFGMGMLQLFKGESRLRLKGALLAILLSTIVMAGAVYVYLKMPVFN